MRRPRPRNDLGKHRRCPYATQLPALIIALSDMAGMVGFRRWGGGYRGGGGGGRRAPGERAPFASDLREACGAPARKFLKPTPPPAHMHPSSRPFSCPCLIGGEGCLGAVGGGFRGGGGLDPADPRLIGPYQLLIGGLQPPHHAKSHPNVAMT